MFEDFGCGVHAAGVRHQEAQRPEPIGSEVQGLAPSVDLAGCLVHLQVGDGKARRGNATRVRPGHAGAAQHGPEPHEEHLEGDRSGEGCNAPAALAKPLGASGV